MRGTGTHPIRIGRPGRGLRRAVERRHLGGVRRALCAARWRRRALTPTQVAGIGFDATCSLVVLDDGDRPVTVSPTGDDAWNVVVWMDHRATAQAARINETNHEVLRYVGGVVSPGDADAQAALAQGAPARRRGGARSDSSTCPTSSCTARRASTCARSARPSASGPTSGTRGAAGSATSSSASASATLASEGFARIGTRVRPMGERAGRAHRGERARAGPRSRDARRGRHHRRARGRASARIGGRPATGEAPSPARIESRLALIGGTSSCHMAVARGAPLRPRRVGSVLVGDGPRHVARRGRAVGDRRARRPRHLLPRARRPSCCRGGGGGHERLRIAQRAARGARRAAPRSRRRLRATCTSCRIITATAPRAPTRRCAG